MFVAFFFKTEFRMFDRVKTAWTNTHLKKRVFAEDIRVLTRHARFIVIIYFNFFLSFL